MQIDILGQLDIFRVDAQRLVTSGEIGPVNDDAAVKAARAQQGLIENFRAVRRRKPLLFLLLAMCLRNPDSSPRRRECPLSLGALLAPRTFRDCPSFI